MVKIGHTDCTHGPIPSKFRFQVGYILLGCIVTTVVIILAIGTLQIVRKRPVIGLRRLTKTKRGANGSGGGGGRMMGTNLDTCDLQTYIPVSGGPPDEEGLNKEGETSPLRSHDEPIQLLLNPLTNQKEIHEEQDKYCFYDREVSKVCWLGEVEASTDDSHLKIPSCPLTRI